MLNDDTLTKTVIPIQGTFDIAQGRNTIRTKINLRRWPIAFHARAATAMTALGEMILMNDQKQVVAVYITFLNGQGRYGVEFTCSLPKSIVEKIQWERKSHNLERAVDTLDLHENGDNILVEAYVLLGKE